MAPTSLHDEKGMFMMVDGATHKMDRNQARTSFFNPVEYVRNQAAATHQVPVARQRLFCGGLMG